MRIAKFPLDEIAARLANIMESRAANSCALGDIDTELGGAKMRPARRRALIRQRVAFDALREAIDRQMCLLTEATHLALGIPHTLAVAREQYMILRREEARSDPGTSRMASSIRATDIQLESLQLSCEHTFVYGCETVANNIRACAVCQRQEKSVRPGTYQDFPDDMLRVYRRMPMENFLFRSRIFPKMETPGEIIDTFTSDEIIALLERLRSPS